VPYLNITEVESALNVATSAPYTGFTQLVTLPNLTWEGRQCHAIKIASGSGPSRPAVYLLGGIHSREWGSADILIKFVEQLEQAYHTNTGLTFGTRSFSAADIQTIVGTLDIIVFPQANPDGRNYSMNTEALWRKNRRTAAPNSGSGACVGVDVNRNYDFLWNFPQTFSTAAGIEDSTNPCDYQLYDGPSAFSEPESRNAKWVFDNFENVAFFVDLHSFGEDLLYSWGDDEDQSSDPTMNFRNPAWDGQRGVAGDTTRSTSPPTTWRPRSTSRTPSRPASRHSAAPPTPSSPPSTSTRQPAPPTTTPTAATSSTRASRTSSPTRSSGERSSSLPTARCRTSSRRSPAVCWRSACAFASGWSSARSSSIAAQSARTRSTRGAPSRTAPRAGCRSPMHSASSSMGYRRQSWA
jgi:hypothetical protein